MTGPCDKRRRPVGDDDQHPDGEAHDGRAFPQPLQWVGRATHAQPGRRQPVLLGKAARRPLTLACFPAKLTASG